MTATRIAPAVDAAAELARRTGVNIPERDDPALRTVRLLADYLSARMV